MSCNYIVNFCQGHQQGVQLGHFALDPQTVGSPSCWGGGPKVWEIYVLFTYIQLSWSASWSHRNNVIYTAVATL